MRSTPAPPPSTPASPKPPEPMRASLHDCAQALRAQRGGARRLRRGRTVARREGMRCEVDGAWLLDFCGNDYRGLSRHPEVVAALRDAAAREGAGGTASHLVCGHHAQHEALEREIGR